MEKDSHDFTAANESISTVLEAFVAFPGPTINQTARHFAEPEPGPLDAGPRTLDPLRTQAPGLKQGAAITLEPPREERRLRRQPGHQLELQWGQGLRWPPGPFRGRWLQRRSRASSRAAPTAQQAAP